MNTARELQPNDVSLLALDGDQVLTQIHCDACGLSPISDGKPAPTNGHAAPPAQHVRDLHRRVYHERGWRRVDALVLCPACAEVAVVGH